MAPIIDDAKTTNSSKYVSDKSLRGPWKLESADTDTLLKLGQAYAVPPTKDREELLRLLNPYADGILDPLRPPNLCVEPPPFTLKTIRDAIPPHCFKRSLLTSMYHLFCDLTLIASLGYLASFISSSNLPQWAHYMLWPLYWAAQGSVMTGLWVLAHECGHQAFSDYEWINNFWGTICHSALLVPYHSWRITHGKHHNNTGSTDNDEVFSPALRSDFKTPEMLRETPIANLWGMFLMLTAGWPAYLTMNLSGPHKYRGKNANHFSPTAEFFKKEEAGIVAQSVAAWMVAVAILAKSIQSFGFSTVAAYYLIPYLIVNYHLVLITFLQHTDVYIPHFRGKDWNWLRGALCTVDRSFGPLLDHTLHHIVDTHVCHHLFSTMPFYHAQEATQHIRRVLGSKYYLKDETPIMYALYRSFSKCLFIEDEGGIAFFKNRLD